MSAIVVLVIPADANASARLVTITATHDSFVALVKGVNTETVFLADGVGVVKVPANGKALAAHGPNPRATQVIERFLPGFAKRDSVSGIAVFAGLDADGDPCEVPAQVIEFAGSLFTVEHPNDDSGVV